MRHQLSKSSYITGKQCEKRLWFRKHRRDLIPPVPPAQQLIFDQGSEVGLLAQARYPGGEDVSPENYYDFSASIQRTIELIASGCLVIYEAAFMFDEVLVAVDILVRTASGWQAVEVKSSTSVEEVNLDDAAVQYYVMQGCGLDLEDIRIMHINSAYVRQGSIDVAHFFTEVSVLEEVIERQPNLADELKHFKAVLANPLEPQRGIGPHCSSPYTCEFMAHCWAHIPDYSVFNVSRLSSDKKWELYHSGITEVADIPANFPLSENQRFEVASAREGENMVRKKALQSFLSNLRYPLYFFDVETMNPAIPLFDGSSPYRQHVFQYSIHRVDHVGAEPVHLEYLAEAEGDFRHALTRRMLEDLGKTGSVLVYNMAFERTRIRELAAIFPQWAEGLHALVGRMVDLMEPFQKKDLYLPAMQGSYSIKKVLPALAPEFSYDDLPIGDGGTASAVFASMVSGHFQGDRAAARRDLLRYCAMDTLAMVVVYNEIMDRASG